MKKSCTCGPRPRWLSCAVLTLCWWAVARPDAARADSALDEALSPKMKDVKAILLEKKATYVGVLKFWVEYADGVARFDVGTLNQGMADRLTWALVGSLSSVDKSDSIQLLRNPSEVAFAKDPKANYRNAEARGKLFRHVYPLLYGKGTAKADLFLTGILRIGVKQGEKKTATPSCTTVIIKGFTRENPDKGFEVCRFEVKTNRAILAGTGKGFRLTGKAVLTADPDEGVAAEVLAPAEKPSGDSAVRVTVRYGKKDHAPRAIGKEYGVFQIPPPALEEKVCITVKNLLKEKVGVVVLVNGVSTIDEEKEEDDPAGMSRWILGGGESQEIWGFQQGNKRRPFEGMDRSAFENRGADLAPPSRLGYITAHVLRSGDPERSKYEPGKGLRSAGGKGAGAASLRDAKKLLETHLKSRGSKNIIGGSDVLEEAKIAKDKLANPVHAETIHIRYDEPAK